MKKLRWTKIGRAHRAKGIEEGYDYGIIRSSYGYILTVSFDKKDDAYFLSQTFIESKGLQDAKKYAQRFHNFLYEVTKRD